ncbi:MAG: heavy metal translocating P-type ATPase [Candidatus Thorarchaeota archaeon]
MAQDEEQLDKTQISIFAFYCLLTIISGILSLIGFEPAAISSYLALIAALIGGGLILYGSVQSLREGDLTVDFLASIAIFASIVIGQYLAAAIVVVMLNGGELVEDYASQKASIAVEQLIQSTPMTARVYRDGMEVEIPVEDVHVGDHVLVKLGEKIPIDGIVIDGYGSVNQAAITGESKLIDKTVDSEVYGNTILEDGTLQIQVTKTQQDTAFFQIIRYVEEARANKAPIERVADRYAKWFAPIIISIAVITLLVTHNILSTVAVLVVSCPCALTLATPIGVVASMGNAAKNGILVRSGVSLEEAGKVDLVVVDKTGTLTTGKPQVVEVKGFNGRSTLNIMKSAASVEKYSQHPIAQAILDKARELGVTYQGNQSITAFDVSQSGGVTMIDEGNQFVVGNRRLLSQQGINLPSEIITYAVEQETLGRTAVFVAENAEPIGSIIVSDTLRHDVVTSVQDLRKTGVKKVIMLTGDNSIVAEMVSKQALIEESHAEVLPHEKAQYVKNYQDEGYRVAMIGDGINDAPALTQANVGIAMGLTGTDVAIETAGIVLTTDDLGKVAKIISLSHKALAIIKQNAFFSLAVNVLGLLLSTQGFVSPIYASIIHESSALIVVFNSLRLATYKLS